MTLETTRIVNNKAAAAEVNWSETRILSPPCEQRYADNTNPAPSIVIIYAKLFCFLIVWEARLFLLYLFLRQQHMTRMKETFYAALFFLTFE